MKDTVSISRLALLHPKWRADAQKFIEDCENAFNLTIRIVQGLRTFADQAAIYAEGRTAPGKIVTWAPPGATYHNYGIAIDICPFKTDHSDLDWNYDFQHFSVIGTKYGITWGGDFPAGKKDYDHFENKFGTNWRDLYHKWPIKDFIPGTEYVNI